MKQQMKRAVILVIVALVLAIGLPAAVFFGFGISNPTLRYENRLIINKPRAEVWKTFTDVSNTKKWLKGLESIELVSGEKGKAGSRYKLVIANGNEKVDIYETLKKIEPEKTYAFTLEAEPLTNEVTVTFEDKGGVTEMVQKEAVTGKTLFWRSVFFWLQSTFKSNSTENLLNFQRVAEGEVNKV